MTDNELIERFESCTLPATEFNHAAHVRMAWAYLRRYTLLAAIGRFSDSLKAYAAHLGKPDLYHETVTWGYMFMINERMAQAEGSETWAEFSARNPDLLRWRDGAFLRQYGDQVLASEFARKIFVLPHSCR